MIVRLIALVRSFWRNVVRRRRAEAALDEELRGYVELVAAENVRAGMAPAAARRAALLATGGVEQVKEAVRDVRTGHTAATVARELRYAVRALRRSPVFTAIAVLTLALGIGGATAVFTIIAAALLRPLPGVSEPDRLVTVERVQQTRAIAEFSYPDYRDLRALSTTLAGVAAFNGTSMALADAAGSTRAWVSFVSDNFFTVLGARPVAGRFFDSVHATAGRPESSQVVVLGHALWQSRYGGARGVIGATLELDGDAFTIIGVAAPGFIGAMSQDAMELFMPIALNDVASPVVAGWWDLTSRRTGALRLVGRLAEGRSVADAQRELSSIAERLAATYPTNRGRGVRVWPGVGMTAEERAELSRVPRLLASAVGLLLLIACGNVAGLMLVRSAARRRQLATQLALGASRMALMRQVVLEGALLATGAGVLGIAIAQVLVRSAVVRTVVSTDLAVRIDVRVLAVAVAASALTALLVSLLPAAQLFHIPPGAVLKDGGGVVRRRSAQRVLVAAQVGVSLVLLSAAAVIFGAFQRILATHGAVDPRAVTFASLDVDPSTVDTARRLEFYRAVLERAGSDPDVESAALTSGVPPFEWSMRATIFRSGEEPPIQELTGRELELGVRVNAILVSQRFFETMRIPLVRGHGFTGSDDERVAPVAIVSRRLAELLWPRQDPLDRLIAWPAVEGPARPPLRVIGVAEDTRDLSLTAAPPLALYVPYAQQLRLPNMYVHVLALRGRHGAAADRSTLQRIVADVNPTVAVLGGETLFERLRSELRPQRTASAWIGAFGAIALLLACIGVYGTVAQGVLQRKRELAVRSALGATPRSIVVSVLADGMRLVALGAVAGGVGAFAAVRLLRSLFTGVQAIDIRTTVPAAAVLGLALLTASYLPARRAARLDPLDALRSE